VAQSDSRSLLSGALAARKSLQNPDFTESVQPLLDTP